MNVGKIFNFMGKVMRNPRKALDTTRKTKYIQHCIDRRDVTKPLLVMANNKGLSYTDVCEVYSTTRLKTPSYFA